MLRGSLVKLTALDEDRIELLRGWRTSPEVYNYLFDFDFISREQQKAWFQNTLNDPSRKYLLIEDLASHPLGLVQMTKIDYRNRHAEWGFFIGNDRHRYGGHAAEAEFLLLRYAFDYLNFNKLSCLTFAFNQKVLSLHTRFGFHTEGVLKEHIYHHGKYEDVAIMSIFQIDYRKIKEYYAGFFQRFKKKAEKLEGYVQ